MLALTDPNHNHKIQFTLYLYLQSSFMMVVCLLPLLSVEPAQILGNR